MAITFKCYDDATLLVISNIAVVINAESDLSDGSHDYTFYFGSTDASQQLQAVSNPGVDNIVLTPTYILPSRANSTAYTVGQSVVPATPNGYRYVCTTAGTSAGTIPTWGTILNGTTTDGSVIWTLVAEDSPITEIKLALTSGGLDTATGGAALSLGSTILSGVANAVEFHMRITNTITQVSSSVGTPELGVNITAVQQSSV